MTQRRQRSRLLLAFVIFSSIILNFAEDCRSNNALLKEKLRQRNRVSHEPPSEGLLLSLKIQDLRLSSPSTLLIDGFLTKRFQDASLDYSRDRPCDEYAVIRIANASTFDTPKISLMNGEWLSGGDKTQINAVVYQNGTVFETERIAISAPCSPNSTTPFGGLVCRLIWHNLAFSQNEMFVTWAEDVSENPAALEKALQSVADYKVSHLEFKHNSIQKFDRVFDELTFEVVLSKSKTKELLLFYVPQIMFVAIAWLSMFLGPMAITRAILIIGSMVLLALHRHFSFNNGHGQTGLEFSAIDTWNLATLIFTFLALVELILITCMASAGRSGRFLSCFGRKERDGKNYYNFEPLYEELNDLRARKTRRTCTCCSHSALAFDIISLFVAAAAWGVFCFFYFFATNDLLQFVNKMPGLLFGSSEAVDFATTETPIEAITELF